LTGKSVLFQIQDSAPQGSLSFCFGCNLILRSEFSRSCEGSSKNDVMKREDFYMPQFAQVTQIGIIGTIVLVVILHLIF
jgi:hypothetical protein